MCPHTKHGAYHWIFRDSAELEGPASFKRTEQGPVAPSSVLCWGLLCQGSWEQWLGGVLVLLLDEGDDDGEEEEEGEGDQKYETSAERLPSTCPAAGTVLSALLDYTHDLI